MGTTMNYIISELVRSSDYFYADEDKQREITVKLLAEAFQFHRDNNKYYRELCELNAAMDLTVESIADISRIPLVDINQFKQADSAKLLSVRLSEIEFEMRSTGTTGTPSISRRDHITCNNALALLGGLYREFFKVVNGVGIYFSTSPEEMPEMGMIKALNFLNAGFDAHDFLVRGVSFDHQRAIDDIEKWEGKFTRYFAGAPFLLNMFLDYLKLNNKKLKLDKNSLIITLGGWKRYTGIQISREEMAEKCREYLGVDAGQIRDMYGLVECNTLAIECEHNVKHIPATAYMSIRSMENPLTEVNDGEHGLVAILDPSSHSYPSFILTEDIGVMERAKKCECGRCSDTIRIIGRAPKSETGCCAVRLDRQMNEEQDQE